MGDKAGGEAEVLFDSGASQSVMRRSVAERLATIIRLPMARTFQLADGKTSVETDELTNIMVTIDGITVDSKFYVLKELGREIVVGASTMQEWDIRLNLKDETITVGQDPNAIELY